MKQLKVGIIGFGRSGRNIHAITLSEMTEKYKVVAITDTLEDRRKHAKEEFGCNVYEDYRDLYKHPDLDLIVITAPSHLHVAMATEILENGFNVLCEKPLARKAADVDLLIETANKHGKLIAAYHNSRYMPAFVQLKKVMESGVLGRIVQISLSHNSFSRRWDWQTLKANDGGNLLNAGSHSVDQALQLFGTDIVPNVNCYMDQANSAGDAEDYVKLILTAPGRPLVDLEISSACAYPGNKFNIQGTCGGLTGTNNKLDWKYYKPEDFPMKPLDIKPLVNAAGRPVYGKEELEWIENSWELDGDTSRQDYYKMLYNTLAGGSPLEVLPIHNHLLATIVEECFRQNPRFR